MKKISLSTPTTKPSEISRKWFLVDATDLVLGRMASEIAMIVRGKRNPNYTANIDCGDNVIVINAEKVHLTGKKLTDKQYFRHTGHPGGIKESNPKQIFAGKRPEQVVQKAVQRMISREDVIGRQQFSKLHVYAGSEHPHAAQKPIKLDLAAKNPKNNKIRPEAKKA
jgi:large subunit ribosomal protein L13